MSGEDYHRHIKLLLKKNPLLKQEDIGVILTLESLYESVPEDSSIFRELYAHLDPKAIENSNDGITFLRIVRNREPTSVLKQQLNSYINIKFNDITHPKTYAENMILFEDYASQTSVIISDILSIAGFAPPIVSVFGELKVVRDCHDFYHMLALFKQSNNKRVRFELLRKLGLIVLIARIRRTVVLDELDERMREVWKALRERLVHAEGNKLVYYFWLNNQKKVQFCSDAKTAKECCGADMRERSKLTLDTNGMQAFECCPFFTFNGNQVLHMEIRNKFKVNSQTSYTSFIEKMFRKNLEFPNQVRDVIAVKIVVESERDITNIIHDLESFLGGTSTRKQEKNTYHKFGRRILTEYSSEDYFVWKAIYDITLPHPSLEAVERLVDITKDNEAAQKELKLRLQHFINTPRDFVIEVQLQDIESHLQSVAKGSPTEHALLKKNQIRSNSFYKFFPEEIYKDELMQLKERMLQVVEKNPSRGKRQLRTRPSKEADTQGAQERERTGTGFPSPKTGRQAEGICEGEKLQS
jgi:hypothetical protein